MTNHGPYTVIYADPPWSYRDKCHAGKRGAGYKYPTMKPEDIKALPVVDLAAKDSVLLLWVTGPQMPVGIEVVEAWGFTYKTIAYTWFKETFHGRLHFGMGHWTRANPEYVLLGVRGKPKRESASERSAVIAYLNRHSEKPNVIRESIERLMGDVPRVELFARRAAPGWDVWGNEIESTPAVARVLEGSADGTG